MATSFKQVVHQNLECSVCLGFFSEPKILACSHTFCKGCLETLMKSQPDQEKLLCPVCRKETSVPDGNVSRLQTNIAVRSLVAEVETQAPVCANCGTEDRALAVVYCKDCSKYFCESCRSMHCKWAEFSGHSLVAASDVMSGKVTLRRRGKCQKHPSDDEECFCIDCGWYVCFKCGVLEHAQEGHKIIEATLHGSKQKKVIEELVSKAGTKICDADKHLVFVMEQHARLQRRRERLSDEIDATFEETIRTLTERKEVLKSEVNQHIKAFETLVIDNETTCRQQIVQMNAVCGLVKNGLKVPLQKEALTAHNTLCEDLEQLLYRVEHDEEQPRRAADDGEQLHFMKSRASKGLELGQLRRGESKWILRAEIELSTPNSMHAMAISPANRMAVGCDTGGILIYSAGGALQETVLKTVKVRGLQFMLDGSYVVRNQQNTISLYTPQCEERDVVFETQSNEKGGLGGLTVDRDGHILSSYRKSKVMQVFKPEGGRAVREIPCHGFQPHQIFSMTSSKKVVVKGDVYTVRVIDGVSGATINSITKRNEYAYPAVCSDESVIVAWVKHDLGLVSIDLYTTELSPITNLLTDFEITKPARNWYYLQQFSAGEIAFCTSDILYIFRETWEE